MKGGPRSRTGSTHYEINKRGNFRLYRETVARTRRSATFLRKGRNLLRSVALAHLDVRCRPRLCENVKRVSRGCDALIFSVKERKEMNVRGSGSQRIEGRARRARVFTQPRPGAVVFEGSTQLKLARLTRRSRPELTAGCGPPPPRHPSHPPEHRRELLCTLTRTAANSFWRNANRATLGRVGYG